MGKNLKGKQLGKGLGQRKDGLYYARCRNYHGEREERCFKTLPEAKNWRQEQLYLRLHPEDRTVASPNMTGGRMVQSMGQGCRWQPCSEHCSELS